MTFQKAHLQSASYRLHELHIPCGVGECSLCGTRCRTCFEQVGGTTVKLQHTNQFAMLGQQQPAGRGEITAHKNKFERHSVEKASLLGSLIQKTVSDSMLENGSFVVFARYKQIAEIFNLFFPHLNVIGNQHGLFQQFQIQGSFLAALRSTSIFSSCS